MDQIETLSTIQDTVSALSFWIQVGYIFFLKNWGDTSWQVDNIKSLSTVQDTVSALSFWIQVGYIFFFSKIEGIPVDKSAISRHWQPCPHYHFEFRNYKNLITRWKMNNTLSINDKMGCLSNLKFSEFNPILSKKTKIVSIFLFWKEITIKCIRKIFFFGQNWIKIEWLGFKDVNIHSREFLGYHVNIPG